MTNTADIFRCSLDQMIDLRHPLEILASHVPWPELEASMASVSANRVRPCEKIEGSDLFGLVSGIANPASSSGRPRISLRLIISLLYLTHRFNKSEERMEELLSKTINVTLNLKLISAEHLETLIVNATDQPKDIAYPTDSRLLKVARNKLVQIANENAIPLKQTFAKDGEALRYQGCRYAHARQFQRIRLEK